MSDIVIAIDGYSGTGKSSTARAVADHLGYRYIDSGAMYRAVTLHFLENNVDIANELEVASALSDIKIEFGDHGVLLNGRDVSEPIRSMAVNDKVSAVSALSRVRQEMVSQQREIGRKKRVVMDGRDIGTIVFPAAELKIFMTASPEVRAKRRQKEMEQKGHQTELKTILNNLLERDQVDSSREDSPLKQSDDSIEIDTTNLSFDSQVLNIVTLAKKIIDED